MTAVILAFLTTSAQLPQSFCPTCSGTGHAPHPAPGLILPPHQQHPNPHYRLTPYAMVPQSVPYRFLCLAFSPDGKFLAAGCSDNQVRVIDVSNPASPKVEYVFPTNGKVTTVAFNPVVGGGKLPLQLAAGDDSGLLRAWRLGEEGYLPVAAGPPALTAVTSVAFNKNGTLLAFATGSPIVNVRNAGTGEDVSSLTSAAGNTINAIAFSPTGADELAAAGGNNRVYVHQNVRMGAGPLAMTALAEKGIGGYESLTYNLTGTRIVAGSGGGYADVYNADPMAVQSFVLSSPINVSPAATRGVTSLDFRPSTTGEDAELASGTPIGKVIRRSLSMDVVEPLASLTHSSALVKTVTGVAYNPTGTVLASSGSDGVIRLWDPQTGNSLGELSAGSSDDASGETAPARPLHMPRAKP